MTHRKYILFLSFVFGISINLNAILRTANQANGDWDVAGHWTPNGVPACGDSLVIPVGKSVNVANHVHLENGGCVGVKTVLVIKGTLTFQNGKKLYLACGSRIYLYPGGKIDTQGGGGNSNLIDICGTTYWQAGDGDKFGPACFVPTDPICVLFLPIELLYFNAEVCDNNRQVCLNWATASEKNNDYFTVERSHNASEFTEIVKINGAGTSYANHNYNYVDEQPINGLSYYRLKQTDFDNTFTYSPIVAISLDFEIAVQNPSHSFDIPLTIKGNKGQAFDIKLVDVLGRVCYNEQVTLSTSGNNKFDINLQNKLSSCVVYLLVSNNFKTAKAKVVID